MLTLLSQHPYFFTNLITLGAVHLISYRILKPAQRRAVLLSGTINMTCFPFLVLLENEYWRPVRWGGGILGIEDALCSYDVAALLWLILAVRLPFVGALRISWPQATRRFLFLGLIICLVFLAGCFLGLRGMTSLLITQIVILPLLNRLKPGIWPLALKGLLLYPLIYFIIVRIYFWLWPDFIQQWNPAGPWGMVILGLPLGEIAWSAGFALWWPPFFAYIFDLNLEKEDSGKRILVSAKPVRVSPNPLAS